jgi:type I restriction enzyme R subunit
VPEIVDLVFIRRVGSRILYEQMLGRATRHCPDIGKEAFRIFAAVGLYDALQPCNTMKAVAVDPRLGFADLVSTLLDAGHEAARAELRDQIVARLRRIALRFDSIQNASRRDACGLDSDGLASHLRGLDGADAADRVQCP